MSRLYRYFLLLPLISFAAGYCSEALAQKERNFLLLYEKGKFYYKQKFYSQASKVLWKAVFETEKGKEHFGAHLLLAKSLFFSGHIGKAVSIINRAEKIVENTPDPYTAKRRRKLLSKLKSDIKSQFSPLLIMPELDPDEVGRLKLSIKLNRSLDSKFLKKVYHLTRVRLLKKGLVLDGKPIFLPFGLYWIRIPLPQCLTFKLHKLGTPIKKITINPDRLTSIAVIKGRSCYCTGGRKEVEKNGQRMCVCPKNYIWNKEKKRCISLIKKAPPSWWSKNWKWLLISGIGLGVTAAVIPLTVIAVQNQPISVKIKGKLFSKQKK